MACIRDESPLALERALESGEHFVQPAAKPGDLVVGERNGQSATRARRRDRRSALAHPLDRSQRGGREQIAGKRGEHQRDRTPHEQLTSKVEQRLRTRLQGCRDDDHEPLPLRGRRHREQAHVFVADHPDEETLVSEALTELRTREQGHPEDAAGRVDDAPTTVEHLREPAVGTRSPTFAQAGIGLLDQRRYVGCASSQALSERAVGGGGDPEIDEQAGGREHDGHHEREREGQADSDRQPADHQASLRRR